MNVNRIASCTVLALAVATIAAAAGIFMVHSTPIVIALIIITAIGTALSIAAVTVMLPLSVYLIALSMRFEIAWLILS